MFMNFLGMGAMEIIVIMVVALIIFGPDKLPEMGAQAGKALRDFRNMTREMTGDFEESISDVRGAMDDMKSTVAEVQRDTRDLATSVTEITDSAAAEVRAGVKTVNSETAQAAAAAKPNLSATATATRPSPTKSLIPTSPQTQVTQQATSVAPPEAKKGAPALPSKKDPLADLGGFDEG
jgi:TatA/E family protein of Tat protein translocase